jgi:hypothetical protein
MPSDLHSLCSIEPLYCLAINTTIPSMSAAPTFDCVRRLLGMCFVIPDTHDRGVFGFPEFVTGFGLLALIYTVSDVRYRFRVRAAALNLYGLTFWLAVVIGVGTLITDFLFAQAYPMPSFLSSHIAWQAGFGGLFLILVLSWLWATFFRPTKFSRLNRKNYAWTLYGYLLQGSESDLPAIAAEVGRSAWPIIKHAREKFPLSREPHSDITARVANDILLLIAMRKFCRHIIASAPGTAMAFFGAMTQQKKYYVPIGQFASNITTEALLNKDSILYHEDEGFSSGYFGYVRPFTNTVYGDFSLIEAQQNHSALDVALEVRWEFDGVQLTAYCRAVLTTIESSISGQSLYLNSGALYRALDVIEKATDDLYKLNEKPDHPDSEDVRHRLSAVVSFIRDLIELLEKREKEKGGVDNVPLRQHGEAYKWRGNWYDEIANLMLEVIKNAAQVKRSDFVNWSVQHNAVWSEFFNFRESKTRSVILFKLRRLIYEEIRSIDRFPNFQNAKVLGMCLNVMGLTVGKKRDHTRSQYQLRKVVISWTRRNFTWLLLQSPKAAEAARVGTITYDPAVGRLVKTYSEGLRNEPPREYLDLDPCTRPVTTLD